MKSIFLYFQVFILFSLQTPAQLGGMVYITSDCASGGFDYYFFDDGNVISECSGCESTPYIQTGEYEIIDSKVYIYIHDNWYGEGQGEVVHVSSINHYEKYAARHSSSDESFHIPYSWFTDEIDDSCEEIGTHDRLFSNPHDILRRGMKGRYPVTYYRLLTDEDLKDKSKKDLRLMRNEIYARYGYIFSSSDLKAHFKKDPYYREFSKDVEAWLSDIEKANVKKIQEFESK
jgi:hypothetical protein